MAPFHETTQINTSYERLLRNGPQCRRRKKSICSHFGFLCMGLSLALYALPAWKELDGFNPGLFEDAIWYVYFLPGVLLAYNYGFKGSLLNAAVSIGVVTIIEAYRRNLHPSHRFSGLDDVILMVGLTTLASLSVGFMAEKLKQKERELRIAYEAVIRNSLTGLYNHGYFQERLPIEIRHAKADSSPLSLLFIDVDNFKKINDTCGHLEGDRVLVWSCFRGS